MLKRWSLLPNSLALAIIMAGLADLAPAQTRKLVFNMTDPREAALWETDFHDESQGPAGLHEGLFRLASGPQAPALMERAIDMDSTEYNRMIVDMRVYNPDASSGIVGSAAFLYGDDGLVIPESRIITTTPVGTRTSVVIRLDQSVFWRGRINRIRFDPVWGVGRADIASITLDQEPPPAPAPQYAFTSREASMGWMMGEFDTETSGFVARPVDLDANGVAFSYPSSHPHPPCWPDPDGRGGAKGEGACGGVWGYLALGVQASGRSWGRPASAVVGRRSSRSVR